MTKRQLINVLDEFDMDEELDMNEIEFVLHFREQEQIPRTYAEIEYDDFDDPEAIMGARFDDMNYLRYRERQKGNTMKVKDIRMLLAALDDELDVKFIDTYDYGIEIMTEDDDFYYSEMEDDKEEIERLKFFTKELTHQIEEQKDMTYEERIVHHLAAWRGEL